MKQIGVAMEKLAKKISSVLWRKQTCFDRSYFHHTGSCIIIDLYMIIYIIYTMHNMKLRLGNASRVHKGCIRHCPSVYHPHYNLL